MKRPQIVNLEIEDISSNEDKSNTEKYIERLELERDQLAASNARLESKLNDLFDYTLSLDDCSPAYVLWEFVAKETPAQSLAEIQARAVESFREYMHDMAQASLDNHGFQMVDGAYDGDAVILLSDVQAAIDDYELEKSK